jgi:uncharacterized lipoprotein YmbA
MKFEISLGRIVLVAGLFGVAAILAGCTVLQPVEDQTRFYSLTRASEGGQLGAVAPADAPTIGVRVISVASHLRKTPIAVRVGEHEVRYEAEHRWAEQLGDSVVRSVAGGVQRTAGPRIHVFVAPALRTAAPDVLIELDLITCEGRRGTESSAQLAADWRVFKGREQKPAASGRFSVEKPGWNGTDFDQLAALLALAVDDLAQAVAGPAIEVAG